MVDHPPTPDSSDELHVPWSWCARCHRAYMAGSGRVVRFHADALHPHPARLTLCPYRDCNANATRDAWRWATIRREHPDYPVQPEPNMVYPR